MKVLIIGANGFLGRHLVMKCFNKDWQADCVYNKNKEYIPKKCHCFHINQLNKLDSNYDIVYLLSSFIPYGAFNLVDERLINVNIKIPLNVVQKFKKSKIIFSSSASVYGIHNLAISEKSSFNNPNLYGESKLAGEFIIKSHTDYQIIRFSSIYGKGMTHETFIPKILHQALATKRIELIGDGSRLQNYLYIEDALDYLIEAARLKTPGIYLGVADRSCSNLEVAKTIQKYISGVEIKYTGKDNSPSFSYNNFITKKLLNFNPRFSLEKGIQCLINE